MVMKTHIIKGLIFINFVFTFGFIQQKIYSQEPDAPEIPAYDSLVWTYIKTPKGDSMEARIFYGEPQEWVAYYNAYGAWLIDQYTWTSPTQLAPGTIEYNCHAYAWYVSEGGNHVWLNYYTSGEGPSGEGGNSNLEKLFSDNSYTFTNDPDQYSQIGRKVLWEYNDHSAITTSDTAYVRSKWGKLPLYQHKKHECPYDTLSPDYYYYKLDPSMSGSTTILCNNVQRTFSTDITNMPGIEYSWDKGPYIDSVSGGAGTSSFTVEGSGDGDSYIDFQLTTQTGFSWSVDNFFYAGKPVLESISGPSPYPVYKGCIGQPYTFWTSPSRNANSESTYQWMVYGGDYDFQYLYQDWATVIFYDQTDYYYVMSRAYNTCGYTTWEDKNMQIINCGYFMIYPNPASDIVTIDFIGPVEDLINHKKPSDITVQILDYSGILYYSANKSGDSFTIPVSNLRDGSYLIIIKYDDKAESLPLIIKH